jgi:hypothetical protein
MKKKRRLYQPHVFDGKIITSDEIERIQRSSQIRTHRSHLRPYALVDRRLMARACAQATAEEAAGLKPPSFNAPNIVVAEADDAPCFQTVLCSGTSPISAGHSYDCEGSELSVP